MNTRSSPTATDGNAPQRAASVVAALASSSGDLDDLDDLRLRQVAVEVEQRLFGRRRAPVRVGRYTLLGHVGEGGMGVVFAAHDTRLDRKVALKIQRDPVGDDPRRSGRLLREAKTLARLAHPNVVQLYDAGEVDGQLFIIMEFIDGVTLREWLAERPRRWRELTKLLVEAGRGLQAAHAEGIIHRDFKPDNVMVDADGRPRVLDFGLARENVQTIDGSRAPSMTVTGGLVGTPAYMAPEQFSSGTVDARTDQFSFCAVAWEALHGHSAFPGVDLASRREAVLRGEIDEAGGERVPARVRQILRRGLGTDPASRHPSMEALLDALSRASRGRSWLALGGAASVVLGLGVAIGSTRPVSPSLPTPEIVVQEGTVQPTSVEHRPWPAVAGCPEEPQGDRTYTYLETVDIDQAGAQASFYNPVAGELVIVSHQGPGKRFGRDGEFLGDVEAPAQLSPTIDGAAFDPDRQTALLVDQRCVLAEVDPVTLAPITIDAIDTREHQIVVCGGLEIGLDGHLYVASTVTDEVVVLTRDLRRVVRRFSVHDHGLDNIDGIALIPGSGELLVLSTFDRQAAIVTPEGELVVGASEIGGGLPALIGGDNVHIPDGVASVCDNGSLWLCEAHEPACYVYALSTGEIDACPCLRPPLR